MLGDDALVCAQRTGQWCGWAPELEEDIASANIALDLLGQARLLLSRAAEVRGDGSDEDTLAYLRDPPEFRNVRLTELDLGPGPGGDFAGTMARLLVFSSWRLAVFVRLRESRDPVLAGVAAKGVKELTYHRDHATRWVLRLAGGTAYSRDRMIVGLDTVWPYVAELFRTHPVESRLAAEGIAVDPATVRTELLATLAEVFTAAGLDPAGGSPLPGSGRDGTHTAQLAPMLAELQSVARAMPGATW
nr:1,2-phenylacetyl-CoA epoxidase subunit PaaC [Micromonospora sp. DSM 115978]